MGKYVIRCTATGCKFDLVAANGEIIASSEVYSTSAACKKGIQGVARVAPSAPVAQPGGAVPPNPRFEIFLDRSGAYRFRLRSRNGKVIAFSQAYSTHAACENGIQSVRQNAVLGETVQDAAGDEAP